MSLVLYVLILIECDMIHYQSKQLIRLNLMRQNNFPNF